VPVIPDDPYWTTTDNRTVQLYCGNALDVLKDLPDQSVHCCITSPPYWGLRDYGVEGQLGTEKIPEEYVKKLVAVLREVRRVLRDDGTLWLNLGDSYSSDSNLVGIPWRVAFALQADGWILRQDIVWSKPSPMPESVRNRCTKSHEYVFLFAKGKGYFYDSEAIKEKAETKPQRRFTIKYIGRKGIPGQPDGQGTEAVRNDVSQGHASRNKRSVWKVDDERALLNWLAEHHPDALDDFLKESSNRGSVWRVPSYAYKGAHYATFPPKLITPCILAGTSEYGACAECGAPWRRVTEETKLRRERPNEYVKRTGEAGTGNSCANTVAGVSVKTVGWEPTCLCFLTESKRCRECGADWTVEQAATDYQPVVVPVGVRNVDASRGDKTRKLSGPNWHKSQRSTVERDNPCECFIGQAVPCVVLDPFLGSGTTAAVCIDRGRHCVGIDLSEDYLRKDAIPRIEGDLFSRPAMAHLVPRPVRKPIQHRGRSLLKES
jgi:DNA modification methylase